MFCSILYRVLLGDGNYSIHAERINPMGTVGVICYLTSEGIFRPQSRQSAKRFSSRWNWDSPTPLAAGECVPPHPLVRGGGHTHLRLKGWGSPNSNQGTYTVVLYIYKYFVIPTIVSISPSISSIPAHSTRNIKINLLSWLGKKVFSTFRHILRAQNVQFIYKNKLISIF